MRWACNWRKVTPRTRRDRAHSTWATQVKTTDPEYVIDVLDFVSDLKQQKDNQVTQKKVARIFARNNKVQTEEELLESVQQLSHETVRRARARTDVVSMMLFRRLLQFWRTHEDPAYNDPEIYIYLDSSPQKRGIELFAASIDILCNGIWYFYALPFLAISRGMLYTVGKQIALLYQIFLIAGPSPEAMRWFFDNVWGHGYRHGG